MGSFNLTPSTEQHCVAPEGTHTSPVEGIFLGHPASYISLKFLDLTDHPQEIPIPCVKGVWMFCRTAHLANKPFPSCLLTESKHVFL